MREIKFRFYCVESCSFSKTFTIDELANGLYDFHCNIDKALKLQYTGLKDKNEVEIYEGDIVKVVGLDENNDLVYRVCEVVFNKGSFVFKFEDGFYFFHDSLFEVIGTIFENKELLVYQNRS